MKTLLEMLVDRIPPSRGIPIFKVNMKWSHALVVLRIDRDSIVQELLNEQVIELIAFVDLPSHMQQSVSLIIDLKLC